MDIKKMVNNETVFQAVVFAESFDPKFGPLTLSQPKVLMPLVNRPLLSYTLDMLSRSNIQETFIFCNQNVPQMKTLIRGYQNKLSAKMNIQVFVSEEYTNVGAAIRDLDAKGLIKSHFVLINGDCVGNLQLDQLFEAHRRNVKNDPGCVMTSVFRRASPKHRIRSVDNETILLLDSRQKIVFFDANRGHKSVEIPLKLLENGASLHYDLVDTHISICSDKVPPDFSDNFDFENREDFINGLLADDELLQHYIYAHILDDGYAARASNLSTYDSISRDIIQRFAFPIVPDLENDCTYRRHNVYLHDKVNIKNETEIKPNVAIGRNTSIGFGSSISNSVIGFDCQIGNNVHIVDSYIWNGVIIEDNCTIEKSIFATKSVLRQGCRVEPGCIIGGEVIIDKNMHLQSYTYLVNDPDFGTNSDAVGPKGVGSYFDNDQDSDNENEELALWFSHDRREAQDDLSSVSTNFSDSSEERCDSPVDEFKSFFNEVYDSLQRGIEEKLIAENLVLEINSSKHAYNVPMKEVNSLVLKAILKLAQQDEKDFFVTLISYMKYMLPVIKNYIRSHESQHDCIYSIEEFYLNNEDTIKPMVFVKLIQYLYEQDVLDEELILRWYNKPSSLPDHEVEDQRRLRSQKELILFIKWLHEAEEESSDSDSE